MGTVVFGAGYIGSRLIQELLFQGREVVAVDNFFASDRRAVEGFAHAPTFTFLEGSMTDSAVVEAALARADEIDAVYLLAAQASANPAAASADYTEEVNLRVPRRVVEALVRRRATAPLVYASSTRVYGSPLPAEVEESCPYGVFRDLAHLSKCYVEKLLEMFAHTADRASRVVRLGLTYGVAPVMKTDARFMTAPNLFCLRAARGEPLEVRSREAVALVHVDDAVQALVLAGLRAAGPRYQVFNAAPEVASIQTIAETVQELAAERELQVTVLDRSSVRDRGSQPTARLPVVRSALVVHGFAPRRSLRDGLAETIDHFVVHGQ